MGTVSYSIDSKDVITDVGGDWSAFASENEGPAPTSIVGRRLFDFVAGPTTREVYRSLLLRVRGGQPVQFPFRCDSPALIREMSMSMTLQPQDGVRFESLTLNTRPMPRPVARLDLPLVRMCSWCRRLDVDGAWHHPEQAVSPLALFDRHGASITHGICPECADMLLLDPAGHVRP